MTHKIFNASNFYGAVAFLSMLAVPAAAEGEMYITAVVLLAILAACAYLSIRESGKK